MSDDILSVATSFTDVASLAQGYMNRADGERLLLPLGSACKPGTGVRFVVYLEDGTPAFAGAGLCSQVSDQGGTVPAEQRYETLLDTLQFDERSRPVYEYIVAVRNAAYAQGASAQAEEVDAELEPDAEGSQAAAGEAHEAELLPDDAAASLRPSEPTSAWSQPEPWTQPAPADDVQPAASLLEAGEQPWLTPGATAPSFLPPALPTGLLTRPARTTHWQPSPPRRPTPRPATGLFRYGTGGLPRPDRPPYPDLDRSAWIQPAPRPGG
jgi:hypothetical protein